MAVVVELVEISLPKQLLVVEISRTIVWQALFDIACCSSRLAPGFSFQPELSASKYYFCAIRKKDS
jgi:hypothetical protein